MIKHALTLDYQLPPGWLQPYVAGLRKGEAIAWRCADCARTSFPPLRTCTCSQTSGEWLKLAGDASVLHHTSGQDGLFALVRFAGADTSTVVKLVAEAGTEAQKLSPLATQGNNFTGRLHPCSGELPELIVRIKPMGDSK